jgi:hypothetical protein
MHLPSVTTVNFESEDGSVRCLDYAVAAANPTAAKAELERHLVDLEVDRFSIEKNCGTRALQPGLLRVQCDSGGNDEAAADRAGYRLHTAIAAILRVAISGLEEQSKAHSEPPPTHPL